MNLKVATKIFGGFTVITLLLIASSVISLYNLSTIHSSTLQQNELAIPTLKGSNELAVDLAAMSSLTLRAYYQSELAPLATNRQEFERFDSKFSKALKKLSSVVKDEPQLSSNLNKVNQIHSSFVGNVNDVFNNRRRSIELTSQLSEQVDTIEEVADEAATLLLDLADHDLADTRLQRAVSLGEQIETQLNSMVSSSFEYRDSIESGSVQLIESEITNALDTITRSLGDVSSELTKHNANDINDDLTASYNKLRDLVDGDSGQFALKAQQLEAMRVATEKQAAANADVEAGKLTLAKQVQLANQTTLDAAEQVEGSVSQGNTVTTTIMVISIVIAVAIAYVTLISITRPLDRVNKMLNIVASGDLSHKLDESGADEFAQLAKNCNLLIDSLRNLIQGIVSRSTQLAAAAEQTSAVTAQSTTAIEEQRNQVEQAASATTEMSSTSQSVLSSANDALGEIKQADDEAERVKTISERNKATIEQLANEVESASQVINKLQQDSASIGGILDVIRGIAEQTNLLALNAAIEAARAGEQGRGFAVVADEVRTLASRTQESTQEIQNMIEVLQTGAEKAVTVMDTGKSQAANCVEQSEQANAALETITHAVHEAYDRSTQIATAAEEQSVVAHEISENLESIVAIAEQTTAGSQQTASSSGEVAKLAEELQQSVQEFKL
ncbi:HAMP domain-containing protein [Endozoicomonas sp. G2_1]|uniref:HAMP domain-containing methyl-accepting chemotaxis protein n=1 Tax=Endozoicomonas sp. G2_1 TaxID=2821091 RepID=UPI001ADC362F|nr:methyl-accepting chemotaxis protein [Endozoicomonas sp. G2_1]MBO9491108.1 HAMP domain-containing protein [Endozoicomonas sp. G2_1]